jgi:hypothetical protein
MALGTLTKVDGWVEGNKRVRLYDVQLTTGANYTTGGETVAAASVGLRKIIKANVLGLALPTAGATSRSVGIIYGNGVTTTKILTHTTASAEAASNSDQSTFTARIEFVGY